MKPEDEEILMECVGESLSQFQGDLQRTLDKINKATLLAVEVRFPWLLRLVQKCFKLRLSVYRYWHKFDEMNPPDFDEKIASLEFGIRYGCTANSKQRAWCKELFDHLEISIADRALLVFTRTINVKACDVRYGRWDRLVGAASIFLHALMILFSISIVLCNCSLFELKILCCVLNVPVILFSILWHKTMISDAHRIGSQYFVANGWSMTPLFKNGWGKV
jgi:hypothetical protein